MAIRINLNDHGICGKCGSLTSSKDSVCKGCGEEFSSETSLREIDSLIQVFLKETVSEEEIEGTIILLNDLMKGLGIDVELYKNPIDLLRIVGTLNRAIEVLADNAKSQLNSLRENNNVNSLGNVLSDITIINSINNIIKNAIEASLRLSTLMASKTSSVSSPEDKTTEKISTEEEWLEEHRKIQEDLLKLREEVKTSNAKRAEYETKIAELQNLIENEIKRVLKVLDELLGKLPKDVIENFAVSDDFDLYKRVMTKLGLA